MTGHRATVTVGGVRWELHADGSRTATVGGVERRIERPNVFRDWQCVAFGALMSDRNPIRLMRRIAHVAELRANYERHLAQTGAST